MKKRQFIFAMGLLAVIGCSLPAFAEEDSGEILSTSDQQRRITGYVSEWKPEDGTGSYTVTDLDGNGCLEILSANYDSSTSDTEWKMWEISAEGEFVSCELPWEDGESQPDVITDSAAVYYDGDNDIYYYIFEDVVAAEDGTENAQSVALSLQDGVLTSELLEAEENTDRFDGMDEMEASFNWISTAEHSLGSDVPMEQILTLVGEAYAGFSLQAAE